MTEQTTEEIVHSQDETTLDPSGLDTRLNPDSQASDATGPFAGTTAILADMSVDDGDPAGGDPADGERFREDGSNIVSDVGFDPAGDAVREWEARQDAAGNPDNPVPLTYGTTSSPETRSQSLPHITEEERAVLVAWHAEHPHAAVIPPAVLPAAFKDPTRSTPGWPEGIPEPGGERKPLSMYKGSL